MAPRRVRYVLGLVLLACVVVLWVGSSVLIQAIFSDFEFSKPFFLTSLNMWLFVFYLPLTGLISWWRRRRQQQSGLSSPASDSSPASPSSSESVNLLDAGAEEQGPEKLTLAQARWLSLLLAPIWFVMNYLFNLGLNLTSVASSTILSTTSGLFVLIFSRVLLKTRVNPWNAVGVALTIAGAACISIQDEKEREDSDGSGSNAIWGDLCSLLSACFYGLYTVTLSRKVPDESAVDMKLVFGRRRRFLPAISP